MPRGGLVLASLGGVAALLPVGEAVAQPAFQAPPEGGRRVQIELRGRAEYDDNVARGKDVVASLRFVRQDDYIYSPTAAVDLNLPVGRQSLFLRGSAGYRFYQYNTFLDRERIDLQGGATATAGRCGGMVAGAYGRRQSDLEDLNVGTTKNVQTVVSESVNLVCSIGVGLGQSLSVQHVEQTSSSDEAADSSSWNVSGALGYSNRSLGSLSLIGSYATISYSNQPAALNVSNGYDMYAAGLRYERPFGSRLNGRVAVQYFSTQSDGPTATEDTGLLGEAALTYRATARLRTELAYSRGVTPSVRNGADYVLDETLALDGSYSFSSRTSLRLGVLQVSRDWKGDETARPDAVTSERRRAVFGVLSFKIGDNGSLSLDARHERRKADVDAFEYTANRVAVTAAASF
jgi:hypothetical protein